MQLNHQSWIARFVNNLSISKKITWGYGLAVGIAVMGTAAGFALGDHYQRQAVEQRQAIWQEMQVIINLHSVLLDLQAHHSKMLVFSDLAILQTEYEHLLENATELQRLWRELNAYANSPANIKDHKILEFLQTYQSTMETYTQQKDQLFQPIPASDWNAQQVSTLKQQVLTFAQSGASLKLHEAADVLEKLLAVTQRDFQRQEAAVQAAKKLRNRIIIITMLLSVIIATLLAYYTSRAIAKPLQTVNDIARKVTQESNFSLQASVTTNDEVGMLADSLNHLIQRVDTLLKEQKEEASRQLIQNEKMSSLGQMLAGVAHEINNPINFIYGNIQYTKSYFQDLLTLIAAYAAKIQDEHLAALTKEIELEFLQEDLPKILQSMEVGATRAKDIVLSLKNFSRLDESEVHPVDIHACLDSTLLILNNRINKEITVHKKYGNLPTIEGYSGSLYQVFMNILSNAIDALETPANRTFSPEIIITTQRLDTQWIEIKIFDNGCGIPPEHQQKIFETFFTTKPIGVGTGLGLSISHQIVVEKHHGRLTFASEVGAGTTFAIALPIQHQFGSKILTEHRQLAGTLG